MRGGFSPRDKITKPMNAKRHARPAIRTLQGELLAVSCERDLQYNDQFTQFQLHRWFSTPVSSGSVQIGLSSPTCTLPTLTACALETLLRKSCTGETDSAKDKGRRQNVDVLPAVLI